MFTLSKFGQFWKLTRTQFAILLVSALSITVAPSFAVDDVTTLVTVELHGSTIDGEVVPVTANILNMQVFEGSTNIYDSNSFAENGCTSDPSVDCTPSDYTESQSDAIIFANVPVSATARYYVSYDTNGGANLGTFDRFLKTGDPVALPNYSTYYPFLGSTWVGLTSAGATKSITLTFANDDGGQIHGFVARQDDLTRLAGSTIALSTSNNLNGEYFQYRSFTTANDDGEFLVESLPVGATVNLGFSGWPDAPWAEDALWVLNSDLGQVEENVVIRQNSPVRDVNLYVPTQAEQPVFTDGSENLAIELIDQSGDPLEIGAEVMYTITASTGAYREESATTPQVFIEGLAPGDYRVKVQATNLFPAVTSDFTVDEGGTETVLEVATYPTGSATITGDLDIVGQNPDPAQPTLSIEVVEFADAPENLGTDFETFERQINRDASTGEWSVGIYDGQSDEWLPADLPDGTYRINFNSPNWVGDTTWSLVPPQLVEIVGGVSVNTGTKTINELFPSEDVLYIKVKDISSRLPIRNMTCYAFIYSDEMFTSVHGVTDENGIATLGGLFRGETYDITCWGMGSSAGFAVKKSAVEIHEGTNNVVLSTEQHVIGTTIRARVVDEDGNPLSNFRVRVGQFFPVPDSELGDSMAYSDMTDDAGVFELGAFVNGKEITVNVSDPRAQFAKTFLKFTPGEPDETGIIDIGDIVMKPGANVTGNISSLDATYGAKALTLVSGESNWGTNVLATVDAAGAVKFEEKSPEGEYFAFIELMRELESATRYARGWIDDSGNLTAAKSDARSFQIAGPDTDLGTYTFQEGSEISGAVDFVDGLGNTISSWTHFVYVKLYVKNSANEWEYAPDLSSSANGGGTGTYSIDGLPDGEYKVCFTDPWTSVTRYKLVCNGGASSMELADPIVLSNGEHVDGVNAEVAFRQPDAAPQPVSLDELDEDLYLALEDQIQVVSRNSGETVIQVDPDLAGQWVAAQVAPDAQTAPVILNGLQARQASSFNSLFDRVLNVSVTSWLQVSAEGTVTIPSSMMSADQQGQIALLGIENNVLGWTDLAADTAGGGSDESGNSSDDESISDVITAPTPLPSDTEVEKSNDGEVTAQNNVGTDDVIDQSPVMLYTAGVLVLAIIAGTAIAIRRARTRN